ncbi:hypothetical protein L6452_42406 [Arctium lappa]|uniref:Uncharacterized protein n=1 Tax=Arctium lappa TaxID=4217 RepID=A0ACB8XM84_ARCLA|nr:hypothetical protein L6452_42406 [Arctium lappa]
MSIPNTFCLPFETEPSMEENEYEKAHLAIIFDRYKDRVTTFPKEKGWISESLYMYHGFWHLSGGVYSIETMMALQETFKAHSTDIYLCTLPKSGTTWMKALMFALVNRTSKIALEACEKWRLRYAILPYSLIFSFLCISAMLGRSTHGDLNQGKQSLK